MAPHGQSQNMFPCSRRAVFSGPPTTHRLDRRRAAKGRCAKRRSALLAAATAALAGAGSSLQPAAGNEQPGRRRRPPAGAVGGTGARGGRRHQTCPRAAAPTRPTSHRPPELQCGPATPCTKPAGPALSGGQRTTPDTCTTHRRCSWAGYCRVFWAEGSRLPDGNGLERYVMQSFDSTLILKRAQPGLRKPSTLQGRRLIVHAE